MDAREEDNLKDEDPVLSPTSGTALMGHLSYRALSARLGPQLGQHHNSTSPSLRILLLPIHPTGVDPEGTPTKPPESGLNLRAHFPGNPSAMGHTLIRHGHPLTCTERTR